MQVTEKLTKGMEQGGSVLAISSGVFQWLGENSNALAGLGVVVGMIVGIAGLCLSWYYNRKRIKILLSQRDGRLR